MSESESVYDHLQFLFDQALCASEFQLLETGYLSTCVINTYLLALPIFVLIAYELYTLRYMRYDGTVRTTVKNVKMLATAAHVVVVASVGPEVLNVISLTSAMLTMMAVFILSYMDLNGVVILNWPLEVYYHIWAGATGYYVMSLIGSHLSFTTDSRVSYGALICIVSLLNGSIRNIAASMEDTKAPAAPKEKAE